MQDATVEKLNRLLKDQPEEPEEERKHWFRLPSIQISLEEGWFSLALVALILFCVTWSLQTASWVANLGSLSLFTLVGLLVGVICAKQRIIRLRYVYPFIIPLGLFFAYWQTAIASYGGSFPVLAGELVRWYEVSLLGGTTTNDAIFLLFILFLGGLLAYVSALLVYRGGHPWIMIVLNAVVLLFNLLNLPPASIIFAILFAIASLLLTLRLNLYESFKRWRRLGLRWPDDLRWDVMQAGVFISLAILLLSWILPANYQNPELAQVWDGQNSPWTLVQNTWNRLVSVHGGVNQLNRGNFSETLVMGSNPNLTHELVYLLDTEGADSPQYVQLVAYDTYSARGWTVSPTTSESVTAGTVIPAKAFRTQTQKQTFTVVNPPGGNAAYMGGASAISSSNINAQIARNQTTGEPMSWIGADGIPITPNAKYIVYSDVSVADIETLNRVLMPDKNNPESTISYYSPQYLDTYLRLPVDFDLRITNKAQEITKNQTSMYAKVAALENYFHTNYRYSVDVNRDYSQDGVSWLLFNNPDRAAFCEYYSSAMAVMARALGLPARVVAGYTGGTYDSHYGSSRVIYGTDAHSWTQVYFAGYGWINFEPSPSFDLFARPVDNGGGVKPDETPTVNASQTPVSNGGLPLKDVLGNEGSGGGSSNGGGFVQVLAPVFGFLMAFLLLGVIWFFLWWQRLFVRLGLASQLYGRLCVMAGWAGVHFQPSQTPYEYVQDLSSKTRGEGATLERIVDIYVRDRWADPKSKEHPRLSGEINELPGLWRRLQPQMMRYVLAHPHFLRSIPDVLKRSAAWLWRRLPKRGVPEPED